jgi:hypothetical protein
MNDVKAAPSQKPITMGIIASILSIAVALALSAPFTPAIFGSWVAFIWISTVPTMLIASSLWHFQEPPFARNLPQPAKGLYFLALLIIGTTLGGLFLYFVPGKAAGPTPMLIMATIMSVVGVFWIVIVWRCWPLTLLLKRPFVLGIGAWILSYLIGYVLFRLCFNFAFAADAPFYVAAVDPGGAFNAWNALVFFVTTTTVVAILAKLFEYWPINILPGASIPVVIGFYATLYTLVISFALMRIFTAMLGFDVVDFMVRVPACLIFGVFLVTNMTQYQFLKSHRQPARGARLLVVAIVLALASFELYRQVGPLLAGQALPPGPPHYALENWISTALLGITFPVILLLSGFFEFWPLKRASSGNHS